MPIHPQRTPATGSSRPRADNLALNRRFLAGVRRAAPATFVLAPGKPQRRPHRPSSRAEPLERSVTSPLQRTMIRIETRRSAIDRAIQQALGGRTFSPAELLALQDTVFTYGHELQLCSRLVDRFVSAVKTTLTTQV